MTARKHFRHKLDYDTQGAHAHTHTDRHAIRKSVMWNTKQSKCDKRRHGPTIPDSQSNGVDEVRWRSLYVSVSPSVSALITKQAAQYSSLTFSFCPSVFFYLALSFSLCSTPPSITDQLTVIKRMEKSLVCECPCVWMCVWPCGVVPTTPSIWE